MKEKHLHKPQAPERGAVLLQADRAADRYLWVGVAGVQLLANHAGHLLAVQGTGIKPAFREPEPERKVPVRGL